MQNKEVKVFPIDDTVFTLQSVFELILRSYSQRHFESGVEFNLLRRTFQSFEDQLNDGSGYTLFVAFEGDRLLGTRTLRIHETGRMKYAEGMWLAVDPVAQGKGVGSKLMSFGSDWAKDKGCSYIWEDTAIRAVSSIKMHEKNRYYIYGLDSYPSTDYYSYVFRKQLTPSLYKYRFFCHLRFCISYLVIKATKTRNGDYTPFGRMIKKCLKRNKNSRII